MKMKDSMTAKEFNELFLSGKIKVSKKRLKINSNELLSENIQTIHSEKKVSKNENKRVNNARKVLHDGITFDSTLETHIYDELKRLNVKIELQKKFVLQDKFKKHGISWREITWTADFFLPDYGLVIEGKGFETDRYKIVKKIFAFKYDYQVLHIKNKKELVLINEIIKKQ